MSTCYLCFQCSVPVGPMADALGITGETLEHCYGTGDEPGTEGLIGSGNYCPCECRNWPHSPQELWDVAAKRWPDDATARLDDYDTLLREHGHR